MDEIGAVLRVDGIESEVDLEVIEFGPDELVVEIYEVVVE